MARIMALTIIAFILAFMLADFIHYIAREDRNYFKSDEYMHYYWRALKETVKKVNDEEKKFKGAVSCWSCKYVVVDVYGDGSSHCKLKNGEWVNGAGCENFKLPEEE